MLVPSERMLRTARRKSPGRSAGSHSFSNVCLGSAPDSTMSLVTVVPSASCTPVDLDPVAASRA